MKISCVFDLLIQFFLIKTKTCLLSSFLNVRVLRTAETLFLRFYSQNPRLIDLVRVSEQLIIFLNLIFTSCSWFMVTHFSDLKLGLFRIVFFKYGPYKNLWKLKLAFLVKVAPLCFIWLRDLVHVSEFFFQSDFSVAFLCASRFCDYYYVIFMISWICLMFLIVYFPVICHVSKPEIFIFWSK